MPVRWIWGPLKVVQSGKRNRWAWMVTAVPIISTQVRIPVPSRRAADAALTRSAESAAVRPATIRGPKRCPGDEGALRLRGCPRHDRIAPAVYPQGRTAVRTRQQLDNGRTALLDAAHLNTAASAPGQDRLEERHSCRYGGQGQQLGLMRHEHLRTQP